MIIELNKIGESAIDVTDYLLADDDTECTQELERKAFQRTHSEMSFHFSDMDEFFRKLFLSSSLSTRWEIVLKTDRNIFLGEIDNNSIEFNGDDQDVEFMAWSKTKLLWEWASCHKINRMI